MMNNENVNKDLVQTKTTITKLLDKIVEIDEHLYGYKMKIFIWSSILVLIVAPILDHFLNIQNEGFTYFSTLFYLIIVIILITAFVSSWRDDNGNWTLERAKYRIGTYILTSRDQIKKTKTNSKDENLFKLGYVLFFGGLIWKSFQNLSVFVRKPIELLIDEKLLSLRHFEKYTNTYSLLLTILGFFVFAYLHSKNKSIEQRIKYELTQLFGFNKKTSKYKLETIKISNYENSELIINTKHEEEISKTMKYSNSELFKDFVLAIQDWTPSKQDKEYKYTDKLIRHLSNYLPDAEIRTELPIGEKSLGNKGKADIVINDSILIEMKKDSSAGAIQRAKGQIAQYSEIWKEKGPVILILCDYDFEKARLAFSPFMKDLVQLKKPVLTIVAKSNIDKRLD